MYLSEPYIQIRNSSIVCYNVPLQTFKRSTKFLTTTAYSHQVTNHAAKRIRNAIDILLQVSPVQKVYNPVLDKMVNHQLSFLTVTISANERHIDSKEGYKLLLKPFLQKLSRKHGLKTYVWRAEYQKNGQLHYHILTPSWIHYELIRNDWNNTLEQHGFLQSWRKRFGQKVPNSTDIHAIYKINNVEAYLSKYMSKKDKVKKKDGTFEEFYEEEEAPAAPAPPEKKGKLWDCSMNLKKVSMFSVQLPSKLNYLYELPERISLDRCIIIKSKSPSSVLPPRLMAKYKKWISDFNAS